MKLINELWLGKSPKSQYQYYNKNSFSPSELVQVIKYLNPMFRGYMQHDSQEFLTYLMDQLHEELKRPVSDEVVEAVDEEDDEIEVREIKLQVRSEEVDSGIHRLSIKSSTTQSSISTNQDGDDVSADSFETCQMDTESGIVIKER